MNYTYQKILIKLIGQWVLFSVTLTLPSIGLSFKDWTFTIKRRHIIFKIIKGKHPFLCSYQTQNARQNITFSTRITV